MIKHNGDQWDLLVNALAIGISLHTSLLLSGSLSGGCINPAVGLIQIPFELIYFTELNSTGAKIPWNLFIGIYMMYIFAPLFGGILAGLFQRYINERLLKSSEKKRPSEVFIKGIN